MNDSTAKQPAAGDPISDQMQGYWRGQWVGRSQWTVPYFDAGFVLGTTVTEQLRTFGGKLFRLDEHLERLERSLQIVGIAPPLSIARMRELAEETVARNLDRIAEGSDLGIGMLVTPGAYRALAPPGAPEPLVGIYAYPLPFHTWATKYSTGQAVVISDVQQVPGECWPAELKCRSRMHYYLADRQAAAREPGSRAILLDQQGHIVEATTANLVIYRRGEGLVSPPKEKILAGISVAALSELAGRLEIPFGYRDILPAEMSEADEALLTSTSICMLPVVRCNGQPIGEGRPGPVYRQLLDAWRAEVRVDFVQQARRFAEPPLASSP